jgi:hypothetical protein
MAKKTIERYFYTDKGVGALRIFDRMVSSSKAIAVTYKLDTAQGIVDALNASVK